MLKVNIYAPLIMKVRENMYGQGYRDFDYTIKIEDDRVYVYLAYTMYGIFVQEYFKTYHFKDLIEKENENE